ncbi:MAG: hypothetical protein ACI37T_05020 [Candidatus Gastranaerophilaceae bacterium]
MKKKFTRIGNSWAILFTKTMIEILDVNPENEQVEIEFDKQVLKIEKAKNSEQDKEP